MQLWWAPNATLHTARNGSSVPFFDFALVGAVPDDSWLSWGPAAAGATNRLMGGADAAAGGWDAAAGAPWAADVLLETYGACDAAARPPSGVCPDAVFGGGDDVKLLGGARAGGVTTLRLRRPVGAADGQSDVALNLNAPSPYVWAHGLLSGAAGAANPPAGRLAQHAADTDSYGSLYGVTLGACAPACAPLVSSAAAAAAAAAPPAPPVATGFSGPLTLAGGGASLTWRLHDGGATLALRAAQPAGWASLGVGRGMVGARAYVAWRDDATSASGTPAQLRLDVYDMASLSASGLTRVPGGASDAAVQADTRGALSFSFFLPLDGGDGHNAAALPLLWALGNGWAAAPGEGARHFARSGAPTVLNLRTGVATLGDAPPPRAALLAHGVLMTVAFGVALPAAVTAARYGRGGSGGSGNGGGSGGMPSWLSVHRALSWGAMALAAGGLASALAAQREAGVAPGSALSRSAHARLGAAALAFAFAQPLNAAARPRPDPRSRRRRLWELAHRLCAAGAGALAYAALFTGIEATSARGVPEWRCDALTRGLAVWLAGLAAAVAARELYARSGSGSGSAQAGGSGKTAPRAAEAGSGGGASGGGGGGGGGLVCVVARRHRVAVASAAWLSLVALLAALAAAGSIGGGAPPPRVLAAAPTPAATPPTLTATPASPANNASATPAAPSAPLSGCALTRPFERARLGDGWCDAGAPHNTAACGWDGGDCCAPSSAIQECLDPSDTRFGAATARGLLFPAPRNPRYDAQPPGRSLSTRALAQSYNNFYEFTTSKGVSATVTPAAHAAMSLSSPDFASWSVIVDGEVAHPQSLDVRALAALFHAEQRVYRQRCVEAWSIIVPWEGFPLRKLLALASPTPAARYVRFEGFVNAAAAPSQRTSPRGMLGASWPYIEALTIEEAWNDLTFLALGQYNATLPPQSGAPLRLVLPWKYGFKSIKSITRITLLAGSDATRPVNWWQTIAPAEYGFYANVNPAFRHPRWSQASESALVAAAAGQPRVPTEIFNGYGDEVTHMYGTTREYFY
jgi:sulfoxide reductase catalytic subunit YedY